MSDGSDTLEVAHASRSKCEITESLRFMLRLENVAEGLSRSTPSPSIAANVSSSLAEEFSLLRPLTSHWHKVSLRRSGR